LRRPAVRLRLEQEKNEDDLEFDIAPAPGCWSIR
jgi:hypothetical protein